jgi:HEAT repeat protein
MQGLTVTSDFYDDPELAALAERLQDTDATVRRIALMDLADLDGDAHVPLLLAALGDEAAVVRAEAARALEAFESPATVRGLARLLSDTDADVLGAGTAAVHRRA